MKGKENGGNLSKFNFKEKLAIFDKNANKAQTNKQNIKDSEKGKIISSFEKKTKNTSDNKIKNKNNEMGINNQIGKNNQMGISNQMGNNNQKENFNKKGMNKQMEMNYQIGMDYQMSMEEQFMDYNDLRIKNIIKPYEEKIKKLEEIIAQKDFQITCLKDKLYRNSLKNKNQQFLNANPLMNQNQFPNINTITDQSNISNIKENLNIPLPLNIIFMLDKGPKVTIQCQNNEKIEAIIKKLAGKADIKEENYSFIYMGKKIDINTNKTTSELGIMDGQTILAIKKNNINPENKNSYLSEDNSSSSDSFEDEINKQKKNLNTNEFIGISFQSSGHQNIFIQVNKNDTVSNLLKSYATKIGISENIIGERIKFLFNSKMLSLDDNRKIKDTSLTDYAKITVIDCGNIIGA